MEHVIYRYYQSIIHGKMRCATFVHDRLARLIIAVALLEKRIASEYALESSSDDSFVKSLPIVGKF